MEAIKCRMRKTVREAIRQSERRGIRVREGGEQDIGTFFALLVANCRRQQKKPRPATETDLLQDGMRFTQAIAPDSRLPNTKGKSSPVHFTYALVNESLVGGRWGLAPTADGIPTMR